MTVGATLTGRGEIRRDRHRIGESYSNRNMPAVIRFFDEKEYIFVCRPQPACLGGLTAINITRARCP